MMRTAREIPRHSGRLTYAYMLGKNVAVLHSFDADHRIVYHAHTLRSQKDSRRHWHEGKEIEDIDQS
jgi:hypothetical protein